MAKIESAMPGDFSEIEENPEIYLRAPRLGYWNLRLDKSDKTSTGRGHAGCNAAARDEGIQGSAIRNRNAISR